MQDEVGRIFLRRELDPLVVVLGIGRPADGVPQKGVVRSQVVDVEIDGESGHVEPVFDVRFHVRHEILAFVVGIRRARVLLIDGQHDRIGLVVSLVLFLCPGKDGDQTDGKDGEVRVRHSHSAGPKRYRRIHQPLIRICPARMAAAITSARASDRWFTVAPDRTMGRYDDLQRLGRCSFL